jgi:hypothetical protein
MPAAFQNGFHGELEVAEIGYKRQTVYRKCRFGGINNSVYFS